MKIVMNHYLCRKKLLIIFICIEMIFGSTLAIGILKSSKFAHKKYKDHLQIDTVPSSTTDTPNDVTKTAPELPDLPVYFEGWLKYLHYTSSEKIKPKTFYKNSAFLLQNRKGISAEELNKTDKNGYINIPNELYFYSVLYKDSLNIFSSRQEGLTHTIDSLEINHILPIAEDDNYSGGVKDFGKFDEGSCFKINIRIPTEQFTPSADRPQPEKGIDETWIICLDVDKNKTQLMNTIINLKLQQQHEKGIYLEVANGKVKQQNTSDSINSVKDELQFGPGQRNSLLDGYWILLQDWSQCTLKCGGGLQYQQLMCVPPKSGGKPCEGPAIRSRPCNSQPCPQPQTMAKIASPLGDSNRPDNSTLTPIVKMMAVSKRPQRYDKCFIKEGDALIEKNDKSTMDMPIKPKIPVRLILNDKTITAYLDDTLTNRVITFVLEETAFIRIANNNRCFKLKTNTKEALICQLDSSGGDFIEEWDYDFNLFKFQCKKNREKSDTLLPEEKKLENEYKKKVEGVKQELVVEIAEQNKKKVEESEEVKLTQKVQQVQATSMMAMQKELKLEELLEKEEQSKEESETITLQAEIEAEKKKAECLNKAVKERELENQYNLAKARADESIQLIQEQTKKDIAKKRLEIKRKIAEMRKKQERKKATLTNEIMTIRTTIASKINKLSKNGNADLCSNGSTETQREDYCGSNFADNYIKYQDCIIDTSFCYVCCENEFGEFHIIERDKCYTKCDQTKP